MKTLLIILLLSTGAMASQSDTWTAQIDSLEALIDKARVDSLVTETKASIAADSVLKDLSISVLPMYDYGMGNFVKLDLKQLSTNQQIDAVYALKDAEIIFEKEEGNRYLILRRAVAPSNNFLARAIPVLSKALK
jgi:hypothetical protein